MAVYGPVCHQKNIIWTSEASVHILIFLVTDRSIYCNMTLSAMNYLLYMDGQYMNRPGTCIILDKKYNIANSSCHFGSYGSIWTGRSPKKYYMVLRSFGPYNMFLITDRSIYCHMTPSAMNYLLYMQILYFTFLFFLFVFVSAAGQYFSILTGPDQYNVFFRICPNSFFVLDIQ